jgi:hypothetical protein
MRSRIAFALLWGSLFGTLLSSAMRAAAPTDFQVPRGQLTFDAEGTEGGRFHSRKPHVPTDSSGLTIGRGYDMKQRSSKKIIQDLEAAGLPEASAKLYAGAAGLSGKKAREYVKAHRLPEITPAQQKSLFAISYAEAEADVKRISNRADVVKKYGKIDWQKLDPVIRDILVDLRFRGDYTPRSRMLLQKFAVANDRKAIAGVLAEKKNWPGVPPDRFKRRRDYAAK